MTIEATIAKVRAAATIAELVAIANQHMPRGALIAVDEAEEFGEHIFHIVADELPGGSVARMVALACETRAADLVH